MGIKSTNSYLEHTMELPCCLRYYEYLIIMLKVSPDNGLSYQIPPAQEKLFIRFPPIHISNPKNKHVVKKGFCAL